MSPLLFAVLIAASTAPAPKAKGAALLDQQRIHRDYNEGNFENVIADIEGFQKAHATYTASDSVFIAKHLAVVYSANPGTREKGKYYMFRLLELLPSAKLVDMYVSDEIDRIFDKVREEFVSRQRGFGVDTARMAVPEKAPTGARGKDSEPRGNESHPGAGAADSKAGHKGMWIAGGAVVAVAGLAATYFLLQSEEQPQPVDQVFHVPKD